MGTKITLHIDHQRPQPAIVGLIEDGPFYAISSKEILNNGIRKTIENVVDELITKFDEMGC